MVHRFGQHPAPRHTIAHVSDTHFLGGGRPLHGAVETDRALARVLERLDASGLFPEAIVITGDLADLGEPDAYLRLRDLVDPAAERLGSRIVWVMGNHDERAPFSEHLLGEEPTAEPLDRVHDVNGLRIIALDTTVPGFHHGELSDAQLAWLRAELAEPAPDGTLVALHHPPIPTPVDLMAILELQGQDRLAEALRGTDVRAILGGHLHYATHGTLAGIPVSVAAATCYTIDASAGGGELRGVDAGQSFTLVQVYDDTIVHSIVPLVDAPTATGFPASVAERFAAMSAEERRAAFSDKLSTFDPREQA